MLRALNSCQEYWFVLDGAPWRGSGGASGAWAPPNPTSPSSASRPDCLRYVGPVDGPARVHSQITIPVNDVMVSAQCDWLWSRLCAAQPGCRTVCGALAGPRRNARIVHQHVDGSVTLQTASMLCLDVNPTTAQENCRGDVWLAATCWPRATPVCQRAAEAVAASKRASTSR